uniref:Uncharacterized protein LOC111121826 isoform X2 n=1 Tax=Crassostrea virginica TaxID=6565 RepID=A0A8B8CTC4_CRAVI|nr:uncharacterized protein LOC111121826 isoform X2 [Crassostrea virginica]
MKSINTAVVTRSSKVHSNMQTLMSIDKYILTPHFYKCNNMLTMREKGKEREKKGLEINRHVGNRYKFAQSPALQQNIDNYVPVERTREVND